MKRTVVRPLWLAVTIVTGTVGLGLFWAAAATWSAQATVPQAAAVGSIAALAFGTALGLVLLLGRRHAPVFTPFSARFVFVTMVSLVAGNTAILWLVEGRDLVRAAVPGLIGGAVFGSLTAISYRLLERSRFGARWRPPDPDDETSPPTPPAA